MVSTAEQHDLETDTSQAKPPASANERNWRFFGDVALIICIVLMLIWPWTFFIAVKEANGIQMSNKLSDYVGQHPHQVATIVTLIGTVNRLIATILFGQAVVRLGQELIARDSQLESPKSTVFGISALLAFRHMTLVWGVNQWRNLCRRRSRLAVVALLLASLVALALIPSGTANLITPVEFNKAAELRGAELDFTADDPSCKAWFYRNQVSNDCGWKPNTNFTTCLGESQMVDVLDSGRGNMLSTMEPEAGIDTTSSLSQLGGIRFLGSAKGVLPTGPDGVPAFDSLDTQGNPFKNPVVRDGMVSYNYTLAQQGLESIVNCSYNDTSSILSDAFPDLNSTILIVSSGKCEAAEGQPLLEVLQDARYPTLNTNNTMTYWACKRSASQEPNNPTYIVYLQGRGNYAKSIGNVTCTVSAIRARDFDVTYQFVPPVPGFFTSQVTSHVEEASQRPTYDSFTDGLFIGLGRIFWEGQNWDSNLVAEAVFSSGVKNFNTSPHEKSDRSLKLFEAMIQGMIQYQATYSRLIYSLGPDLNDSHPPPACFRAINGTASYSVRGWFIDNLGAQAGLLIPMFLINLTSLSLIFACCIMGQFRYTSNIDVTDSMSLMSVLVVDGREETDGKIEWNHKVRYGIECRRG